MKSFSLSGRFVKTGAVSTVIALQVLLFSGFAANTLAQDAEVSTQPDQVVVVESASPTPEVSVESTPAPEASATPEPSVAPTPEATPEATPEPSVESTPIPSEESAPSPESIASPELSTDRDEYQPGEEVTIFGKFFQSFQNIVLKFFGGSESEGNYMETTAPVTADATGAFSYLYQLETWFRPVYTVIANAISGEKLAETTFVDPAVPVEFHQCANNNITPAGKCDWIGSILQASNSVYYEGMTVPQRVVYPEVKGNGTHTLTFTYSYTKGSIHAYDFIATVNPKTATVQGVTGESFVPGITDLDPCGGLGSGGANPLGACTSLNPSVSTPTLVPIPADAFDSKDSAPVPGSGSTQAVKESAFEANTASSRNVTVYSGGGTGTPFTVSSVSVSHIPATANGDTGDTNAKITLTFTSSGCSNSNPCKYLFYFGGHLAVGGADNTTDSNWGPGLGSSSISGGPYHIKDLGFDGGGGSLDNQIMGASILLPPTSGAISGLKFEDLDADGIQDPSDTPLGGWTISLSGPTTTSTVTAGDGTYSFSSLPDGTYTVCETLVNGWTQTFPTSGALCSGPTFGYTVVISGGSTSSGNDFGNTQKATLTLLKIVINDNGGTAADTDWTLSAAGPTPISGVETDAAITNAAVLAGSYTLSESTGPAGYTPSLYSCVVNALSPVVSNSLTLSAGDVATCTITNDDQAPKLTLVKTVINDNGGDKVVADFPLFIGGSPVTSGVSNTLLANVLYSATEIGLGGYAPSAWGGDCAADGTITLQPGDDKTCTIVNNDQAGHLIVHKITITNPVDITTQFSITPSGGTVMSPAATQNIVGGGLVDYTVFAGTYDVSEAVLAGWDETGNTCVDVVVANGETEECTITNTQRGHVIIKKDAITDSDQAFTFYNDFENGNPASFNLTDDSTPGLPFYDAEVLPGTYAVSENEVDGWQSPESTSCDDDDSTVDEIVVSAGETVTCTFVNEKLAKITLVKNTIGGDATFDFVMTGIGLIPSTQLTTVLGSNSEVFTDLDPDNTYTINETPIPAGWANTGASCDNGDPVTAITPNAGEEIVCTFTNNKPAAQIDITPLNAFNALGNEHEVTASVQVHNGNGTWGPAADGTTVTFSLVNNNNGSAFVGGNTCLTVSSSCSVSINAVNTGSVEIHASADPVILGATVSVQTDDTDENSANGKKTYVNARISIAPEDATNEVGDDHDFVVTVEQSVVDGVWTAVENALVDIDASPAPDSLNETDCNDGTNASGQCTATISSNVADVHTVNASTNITVNTINFSLATNGSLPNSGPATKTYVDASIALSPKEGINDVNDPHLITATVMKDEGTGPTPAVGETVTFSITLGTADFVGGINTCITNASGVCSVSIVDDVPGDNEVDASVTVTSGTLELNRATDTNAGPGGSDEVKKTYIAGKIIVQKVTIGGDGIFNFNADYSADFPLANGGQNDSGYIPTGNHSVSEDVPADWDLTSTVCTSSLGGSEDANAIALTDGEVVTCVFTNTKRGSITIVKDATPNDLKDFQFNGTLGSFILDDDAGIIDAGTDPDIDQPQSKVFLNLAPNQEYAFSESLPDFWALAGITCVDATQQPYAGVVASGSGVTITLAPGADVTCTFTNTKSGPSRTLGFWRTHTAFTTDIFEDFMGNSITIGTVGPHMKVIDTPEKLFGAYYADIPKKSDNKHRQKDDQVRIQMVRQLLTAKLNCAAFGGCGIDIYNLVSAADAAYSGSNTNLMLSLTAQLDAFNNSGDTIIISPPLPWQGKATPNISKSIAESGLPSGIKFWDTP